jgi:SAM-dependent methyltransferase
VARKSALRSWWNRFGPMSPLGDSASMRTVKTRGARKRSTGLSAANRAMWTRLYADLPAGELPWGLQKPFPPMLRAVESGWLNPPGPILDVGCGVGSNALWLAARGFQVTGIDVAPGAIAAAESARGPDSENPTFLVDDVLASTLPPASFPGAIDVGCFQTLPTRARAAYAAGLARLMRPGAPCLIFWVGREESGAWGPPHRLSVTEVAGPFESDFLVERIEHRPRTTRLTPSVLRSSRPLSVLAGYSARLVRRRVPQPAPR